MNQTRHIPVAILLLALGTVLLAGCEGLAGQPPAAQAAVNSRATASANAAVAPITTSQPAAMLQSTVTQPPTASRTVATPQATAVQPVASAGAASADRKLSSELRANQDGAVVIEVTPAGIKGDQLQFTISLNTHSVDLSYDYKKLATLRDDQGHEFAAVAWDGGMGGHHLQGTLSFTSSALGPQTRWLELDLRDIGKVANRTFRWDVSG